MKRPWQIWALFFTALLLVVVPMVWLSFKAVQADRQREMDRQETELARQQAEFQERLSSALYRLDLMLLPLVSEEVARPAYAYDAFYASPWQSTLTVPSSPPVKSRSQKNQVASQTQVKLPSPLVLNRPRFVKMHLQIDETGAISSPQYPQGKERELVLACCGDMAGNSISKSDFQLAEKNFEFKEVSFRCALPEANANQPVGANSLAMGLDSQVGENYAYNVPAIGKLLQSSEGFGGKGIQFDNKYDRQLDRNQRRGKQELEQRMQSTTNFAQQQWLSTQSMEQQIEIGNRINGDSRPSFSNPYAGQLSGAMQSMWINDELVLARKITSDQREKVQVCWLDWEAIQDSLTNEIKDLFPRVKFEPLLDSVASEAKSSLSVLPIQLVVDNPATLATLALDSRTKKIGLPSAFTGLTVSLLVAWGALALTTIASMFLLFGVIQMSERRAAFVSAVTHELRTPLTTFRMYAEMLAENMVPPHKTQEYASTLRVEADRLAHLVENVLQFARLEKGNQKASLEEVSLESLLDRFHQRLVDRAEQAEMTIALEWSNPDDPTTVIQSQPAQIEQVLFNLVDNACKYAKPSTDGVVRVTVRRMGRKVQFRVSDRGPGVARAIRGRLFQPFCKSDQDAANTAPGVGLGLALCRRMARALGGKLFLESPKQGACFVLEIPMRP